MLSWSLSAANTRSAEEENACFISMGVVMHASYHVRWDAVHPSAMGLGRRGTAVSEHSAWVFNRMADVYDARPAYPEMLIESLAHLAGKPGAYVGDLGAGIGHVALPLAQRGFDVTAVEPARAMLDQLEDRASRRGLSIQGVHAAAEAVPVEQASFDLVVIADALHFLDAELTGIEVDRVLDEPGALAMITSELGDTPFMRALVALMEEAAPRRPRETSQAIAQVAALSHVTLSEPSTFVDHTPVSAEQLQRIVKSISFIGPAMNPERFTEFWRRVTELVTELPEPPVWSRRFTLHTGRRG
jgi:ubiquinone/menaquinone biosynthesis C-methylase UbiE